MSHNVLTVFHALHLDSVTRIKFSNDFSVFFIKLGALSTENERI